MANFIAIEFDLEKFSEPWNNLISFPPSVCMVIEDVCSGVLVVNWTAEPLSLLCSHQHVAFEAMRLWCFMKSNNFGALIWSLLVKCGDFPRFGFIFGWFHFGLLEKCECLNRLG